MIGLQFRDDEDVDLVGGAAIFEMECHGFADVAIELVDGFGLGEDVFADASGAPGLTIVIHLNLCEHVKSLAFCLGRSQLF